MFPVNVMPDMKDGNDGDDDGDAAAARLASQLLTMTGIAVVFRRRIESVGAKLVFRSSTRKS